MIGEMSSTLKTLVACSQSTPEVPLCTLISWLATPTPMMEPTMVWELDAGSPNHQVPRFQMMAAMSKAKTMAKPAPELTCRINSTGSKVMTVKATAPLELSTPARLHNPGPHDGDVWLERVGIDDRGHGVRGVVEAVDELESECDQQSDDQQHIRPRAAQRHATEILRDVGADEPDSNDEGKQNDGSADHGVSRMHLLVEHCSSRWTGCDSGCRFGTW